MSKRLNKMTKNDHFEILIYYKIYKNILLLYNFENIIAARQLLISIFKYLKIIKYFKISDSLI